MAASDFTLFKANIDNLDMQALAACDTFKMALCVTAAALETHAATDGWSTYSQLTNELSTGGGYTAGGVALASSTVAANGAKTGWVFTTGNATWTAADDNGTADIPEFRYAVLYADGTLFGISSPLIGYMLCDATPANVPVTTEGNTLTITCPATGWFDMI